MGCHASQEVKGVQRRTEQHFDSVVSEDGSRRHDPLDEVLEEYPTGCPTKNTNSTIISLKQAQQARSLRTLGQMPNQQGQASQDSVGSGPHESSEMSLEKYAHKIMNGKHMVKMNEFMEDVNNHDLSRQVAGKRKKMRANQKVLEFMRHAEQRADQPINYLPQTLAFPDQSWSSSHVSTTSL